MNRMGIATLTLSLGLLGIQQASAEESSFNVYGFADASFSQSTIKKNSFLYNFVTDDFHYGLNHFNIYSDWKPNSKTRALLEMGFADNKTLSDAVDQRIIVTHLAGYDQLPATVKAGLTLGGVTATRVDTAFKAKAESKIGLPQINRAYFEVMLDQYVNFRIGRFITPAGIWNVDHGSPVILPIKQPYQTTLIPIFPVRQEGITVFGNGFFGDNDYDYSVYVSTGSDPEGNVVKDASFLSGGSHVGLKLDLPVKTKIGLSGYSGISRKSPFTIVGERTTAITNFFDSTGFNGIKYGNYLMLPPGDDKNIFDNEATIQDRHLALGVDLRLDYQGAFIQAEFNQRTTKNELMNDAESKYLGYYGIVGYKLPAKEWLSVTPYFMYESISWENIKNSGASHDLGYLPMEGFDSFIGGVNVGLYGNLYVKFEYSMAKIKKLDAAPLLPYSTNKYSDSDLDISSFSGQFAIAF